MDVDPKIKLTPPSGAVTVPVLAVSNAPDALEISLKFFRTWCDQRGLDPTRIVHTILSPEKVGTIWQKNERLIGQFVLTTHSPCGQPSPGHSAKRIDQAEPKYISPPDSGISLYAPQPDSWSSWEQASNKTLAEGQGKTLAIAQHLDQDVIGFPGIKAWHRGDNDWRLHQLLADRIHEGDVIACWVDGDIRTNEDVRLGAGTLLRALLAAGAADAWVYDLGDYLDVDPHVGADDLLAYWRREGEDVHQKIAALPKLRVTDLPEIKNAWIQRLGLSMTAKGEVQRSYDNVIKVLEGHYEWQGRLETDRMLGRLIDGQPFKDTHYTSIIRWFEQTLWPSSRVKEYVRASVDTVLESRITCRAVDWLRQCESTWDGVDRLDTLFHRYYGTPEDEYHCQVGRAMLVGTINRVLHPGCKHDHMVILEGEQGTKKTESVRNLFGDWVVEIHTLKDIKDFWRLIRYRGLALFDELHAFTRIFEDWNVIKNLLTSNTGAWVDKFDKHPTQFALQNSWMGTTNEKAYLPDEAGTRRFFPVDCHGTIPGTEGRNVIDIPSLILLRVQLFGEAMHLLQKMLAGTETWYWQGMERAAEAIVSQRVKSTVVGEGCAEYLALTLGSLPVARVDGVLWEAVRLKDIMTSMSIQIGRRDLETAVQRWLGAHGFMMKRLYAEQWIKGNHEWQKQAQAQVWVRKKE